MKPIQAALRCPDCGAPCQGPSGGTEPYRCTGCQRTFPLLHGVLHMAPKEVDAATRQTVDQFGASWSAHEYLAPYQERQFLDWIAPFSREGFEGRTVLEAGCGKGRHTFLMAGYGVGELLAVDLSEAVYLAAEYTKAFPWVHRIRADLLRLPLADGEVDLAVCLGVLHHLKDPEGGLRELWRVLRPGGTLVLWVYAREGNGWIVHLVDPLRKGVTSRIPIKLLRPLLLPLSLSLYTALKVVYGPATGRGEHPVRWLPYSAYLGYISRFPFREIEHIVLDHLCPPIAHYLPRPVLEGWFASLGAAEVSFRWHNRNSWTVVARKP
ncbi:MAG: methyltransferase domain-containing protein [Acidobacteriota bacterium]